MIHPVTSDARLQPPRQFGGLPVVMFCVLLGVVMVTAYAVPKPDSDLAVIVSPWGTQGDAVVTIAQAGGMVSGTGRWPFIAFTASPEPGLISALYAEGAWLVIDAGGLAACRTPRNGV